MPKNNFHNTNVYSKSIEKPKKYLVLTKHNNDQFCITFLYICYTMILKTSQNQKETYNTIKSIAGSNFSLIEKFKFNVFGSPKYKIISIQTNKDDFNIEDYTDLVCGAFELRKNGIAFYFRYKNEEYIIVSRYNQISFLNNDGVFDFQFSSCNVKLHYENIKMHKKFISRIFNIRNMYLNKFFNQ